ncbi:hypothetical protein VHEMI03512 [[Torrubiella] hemipterigena]|uniref:Ribosomal RNA-processing protein 8 n=1 Tax=[Torrubiella] hemipterigena TaxID=1531966 RepID=A0A0A1TB03_9HYPO|nr:hypothetical protein VHEMI03512 [[Torrubiella] hemipterigena]
MFAVPGWSVSSDALKVEKSNSNPSKEGGKSKKRKRPNSTPEVNSSNVTSLWESVVEGRSSPNADKSAKRSKKEKPQKEGKSVDNVKDESKQDDAPVTDTAAPRDTAKKGKKGKKSKANRDEHGAKLPKQVEQPTSASSADSFPVPAGQKLTPLQAAMRDKLISARFRHLNETLYTRPSEESFNLFQESPEMFSEYHEGFRQQVKVWPENPVDSFLKDIQTRGKIKQPFRGKPGSKPSSLATTPLPRTEGVCTIADLGCGDAQLSQSLQASKAKLNLNIRSYDLQSPIPLVTKADIANLPLQDGDVNLAIFCLALMGTNWIDFIEEAYRVLHWKGELWVAEIKSRFGPVRNKSAVVEHSVGNRKKAAKAKGKESGSSAAHDNDLAVEVDGADDRRRETDVSAFVEALQKRGFVLNGERTESVDLSNKMFVKMRFIKGASPTKGKGASEDKGGATKGRKKVFAPRIDQEQNDQDNSNEAAILKPCVYKIR